MARKHKDEEARRDHGSAVGDRASAVDGDGRWGWITVMRRARSSKRTSSPEVTHDMRVGIASGIEKTRKLRILRSLLVGVLWSGRDRDGQLSVLAISPSWRRSMSGGGRCARRILATYGFPRRS